MTSSLAVGTAVPLAESVAEAFANLRAQGQRSLLALLGILIGTASIVALLAIGHMAQRETLKLFSHLGVEMVQIHAAPAGDEPAMLDRRTIEGMPSRYPAVVASAPMATDRAAVSAGAQSADLGVAAVTSTLPHLVRLGLRRGRFIESVDDQALVAVVGSQAAEKLSAPGAPLVVGSRIRLNGYVFTVIGLMAAVPYTALDPTDFNGAVFIPMKGAGRVMNSPEPDTALFRLRPGTDVGRAGAAIAAMLAWADTKLQVQSAQELIAGMNAQKAIHNQLLAAIGAISLLVGGIGVMNVMLMGVLERRREIGLRAAIGATPRDLRIMFLVEAVTLASVGGVAGLVLGLFVAAAMAAASGWAISVPLYVVPMGPGLGAAVGVAFGYYPAAKAARLDPIEALRAE